MVQIGAASEDESEKPKFSKLKPNQSISTITLEEALECFALPRVVGQFEDKDLTVNIGRFGAYVAHDGKFYSLKKTHDPYTVTSAEALEVIEEKRNSILRVFEGTDISIVVGRWGPYIKAGKKNVKLPKDADVKKLKLEEIMPLIEAAPEAKPRGWGARKKKK